MDVKKLFNQATELGSQIETLKKRQTALLLQVANAACPYKQGDKIFTSQGLGVQGLHVDEVLVPQTPEYPGNLWKIGTFAYTLDGKVSKRYVGIEQRDSGTLNVVRA